MRRELGQSLHPCVVSGLTKRPCAAGELTSYTDLLKEARQEAMERMNVEATQRGANAVIGIRITSSSVTAGASEILMYGTAVRVEKQ